MNSVFFLAFELLAYLYLVSILNLPSALGIALLVIIFFENLAPTFRLEFGELSDLLLSLEPNKLALQIISLIFILFLTKLLSIILEKFIELSECKFQLRENSCVTGLFQTGLIYSFLTSEYFSKHFLVGAPLSGSIVTETSILIKYLLTSVLATCLCYNLFVFCSCYLGEETKFVTARFYSKICISILVLILFGVVLNTIATQSLENLIF